jgi:DNA helicase II / ATP-dependent DNA helicase PcrA
VSNHTELARALADLSKNAEQREAVQQVGHCVVLAGPGSGKTKTLTTAMARTLSQDVIDPRGVACITYNNECAIELESRLARFGIASAERTFIGTVHSFALTQVITPYVRCVPGLLDGNFRVATAAECRAAVEAAHQETIDDGRDPHERWRYAEEKRRRDVDRSLPDWMGKNPELARFIEQYEAELRLRGLVDFDDMPLLAFRLVKEQAWVREAIRAKFPVLFVDEYQDLGYALHELVLLLCFHGGIRLFAVGDSDQSIYGFTGANPELLRSLTERGDVRTIRLRFNYRSGLKIIRASLGALGEERDYRGVEGAPDGELSFIPVNGSHDVQAQHIANVVIPGLIDRSFNMEQIAVLYRAAWLGNIVAEALDTAGLPYVRTDGNALVKRSSRLARLIEACSQWVTDGWRSADPPYSRLAREALGVVFGGRASESEEHVLSAQLVAFLRDSIDKGETTHQWLRRFNQELITPWKSVARNRHQEWDVCSDMIARTDPAKDLDTALNMFSGRLDGSGRLTLSTLHSAKGREFDAVVMFGINDSDMPSARDKTSDRSLREARRLFYVGVTRPRKELCLVFQTRHYSPWVAELYKRSQQS